MLHLKHPVRCAACGAASTPAEFKAEEAQFPQLKEALAFIKRL